ncbi:melanoma inhibitory activity protein 2 isoform X4 [Peromyscus maniculatus bairdii]|uniref:melanoma inhibitory activity protein 2 isoform X4 n=1 Tax=Peromyscus maniculatus bairdii TaxID=230844 RepID=UPI00077D95F2|nr:melanoma inhibitory activity protein 2 isoform X4 [Peromyscus maniculatus bairdii]
MAEISVRRILLLVISLAKCLEGTELLAHLKKCGDLECETLISRVLALRDHTGPDCRYLNFTTGEEISVYVKLAGEREDLWAGSKGKDFGFFPRDAVQIEEVFISEEVEMPTKESDFLCLLGEGYIFGSEHSELNRDGDGNVYPYEEDEDPNYSIYESDFQPEPDFYVASKGPFFEDQISASEAPEDFSISNESKDWEEAGSAGSEDQDYTPDVDHVLPSQSLPETQEWFGLGREETGKKAFETDTEPTQESSFQSRKLTVEEENDLEKLNNAEPQMELEQDPESQFDSETPEFSPGPEEQYELVSESENILKPPTTGWFGGGFTSYLGFGEEDPELELLSKESNPPSQDVPSSVSPDEEAPAPRREAATDEEDAFINDSSTLSPNWFNLGFGMLGFAYADEDKSISDDGESEGGEVDTHKHPLANDFDPGKERERKMITAMETEVQANKDRALEKTDDSESMQYLARFFNNPWSFQNLPEDTELPFSQRMLDQDDIVENDKTEELSTEKSATENMKDPMMLEGRYSLSDTASEIELPVRVPEGIHFKTSSLKGNEEDAESRAASEGPAVAETDRSVGGALLGSQLVSQKEQDAEFQILKYFFQIDVYGFMNSAFSPSEIFIERVVAALPEDMRAGFESSGLSLELAICVLTLGLLTVLLFVWRGFRSIRSRFYVGREKKLALELSAQIEEKCKLLEKVSLAQKEATYENLESLKSKLEDEILFLEKELEEERAKHSEQDDLMADTLKEIQSLEDESNALKAQVAEAKTTLRIFEINKERLVGTIKDALDETAELQESHKQLLQEAEVMREKVNELNKQKVKSEESKVQAEQVLNDKDNQIKSLVESLLKTEVWTAVFGEHVADDGNLDWEVKSDLENDAHLDNQPTGALKKLIYAVKLNASLKALEGERNQIYTQLSEVDKTKEDLTERIRSLESEQESLPSEITEFENEKQKLQQKLQVMTELYQENEMKLHRKLTVEENYRLEKEKKLSKVKEKISYAAEELETCRQRAKDLEEELERTIHSYQGQVIAHEKKAHDNWLVARTCERNLNDLRKENAHNRQKLTEAELKLERLEKDPYALDVPNTAFGREHSPYGPSPLGRPSSETRAFLSPPTLLEGPLRLSPLLPGGGRRGPRGPENLLDHQMNTERGESSCDRLSGAPRAPSDKSLSPPWEQDRRMMAPPPDGPVSSEKQSSRNDTKDQPGNSKVPDSPGHGFVPPPGPPVPPVDPRSQFMGRACPFPPPSPRNIYGAPPDYYSPPNDFPGPPRLPFPGRNVYPPRGFPPYLPPRAGFFPPPPHPESRRAVPPDLIPPSKDPAAEPPEPQET